MKLAYLTTSYPAVSHTFIRREILELERRGHKVERFSIRSASNCVDPLDILEQDKTFFCLEQKKARIFRDVVSTFFSEPVNFLKAFSEVFSFNRRSDRGLLRHFAYLAEACVIGLELRERQVQHIHTHFGTNSTAVSYFIKRLTGISYSFTVHGPDEFDAPIALSLKEKVMASEFVVTISHYGQAQLKRWVPLEQWHKIIIVGCTVDEQFTDKVELQSSVVENKIVCVARLSEQKGIFTLLDAIHILKNRGIEVRLVLAGDGPLRQLVETKMIELNIQERVEITGWISGNKVKESLLSAKALVLPSFAEGLPVVIMESFSLGKPVITSWVAGIPELVKHGENGWLVTPNDVFSLAEALENLFETPDSVLDSMGAAGRGSVLARHSIMSEIPKLEKALLNVMETD